MSGIDIPRGATHSAVDTRLPGGVQFYKIDPEGERYQYWDHLKEKWVQGGQNRRWPNRSGVTPIREERRASEAPHIAPIEYSVEELAKAGWLPPTAHLYLQHLSAEEVAQVKVLQAMGHRVATPDSETVARAWRCAVQQGGDEQAMASAALAYFNTERVVSGFLKGLLPWDGTGLPPVGTDVEYEPKAGDADVWRKGNVVAQLRGGAVIADSNGDHVELCYGNFRPIRTPEQIAAGERKAGILALLEILNTNFEGHVLDGLSAIYDAGYRKPSEAD